MAGDDGHGNHGGGRSYGNGGFGATELERGCGVPRRPPGVALSTVVCSVAALGDSGHGGDMNGGAELSAKVADRARGALELRG